ncbi:MAG: polysaccharide deacetylase family protein [Alphaproteobacteria bacterium]
MGMFSRTRKTCARFRRRARLLFPAILLLVSGVSEAAAPDGAVVLMYHRFGESDYPASSVTLAQFDAHLALLTSGPYNVLPVSDIVAAMQAGTPLPDRTIGITIDDAYLSVFEQAWPRLRKAGLPFTVFVATQTVDRGDAPYMNWDQVREMKATGVTIGAHTDAHLHMPRTDKARIERALKRAAARFRAELGQVPALFAYPYGEASSAVRDIVIKQGFTAAFGQHSGASYRLGDRYFLPRFPLNEQFGDMAQFRQRIDALALPAIEITPADPFVGANPPAFGFTVDAPVAGLDRLACYHPEFDAVSIERLGRSRFEVRFPGPFQPGRSRLNCTVPGPDNRYRWFGWQFYVGKGR